ncbi:LPS-assembly lipoprotein [Ketogulonicigenium robustum]|uniref:LPS-assembly lipoprotein n=1 Tax=Ketogulonicigenium robustum TaxID=92947 RepID=A0A1W6P2K9_9RHOB|nr:LPS-assembly lipoprotein [Ketogulonicigenium robustum]
MAGALAGCGFSPVYGPSGPANHLTNRISYAIPETALAYRLRQALRDSLGEGSEMALSVSVSTSVVTSAETRGGEILRYTIPGTAQYRLTDSGGRVVASGTVDAFTGYSASASTRAVAAARVDAEDRLARLLAERIVTQLLVATAATPAP